MAAATRVPVRDVRFRIPVPHVGRHADLSLPQTQARINDLATKVFTAYEIQKMRTYIPDLQFKVEEAPLIQFNMLDTNSSDDVKAKLGRFIAAVYMYDILTNMMRDYNERVRNVTSSNLLTTDSNEVGKIATALRGFKAVYKGTDKVFLQRIPADVLENAKAGGKVLVPSPGLSPLPTTKVTVGEDELEGIQIDIKLPAAADLPKYNLAKDKPTVVSDDCQPAKMIYHLGSGNINYTTFASIHHERLGKLVPGTDFDNPLIPFIRRDILAFNRLRIAILNAIDAWAMTDTALKSVTAPEDAKIEMPDYLRTLMVADQRVSGLPQPSCGSGFAGVFYDADPANPKKKAKIVDPYIVAADGSLVENPRAKYGPYCQRKRMTSDLLSGVTTGGPGRVANFHTGSARRVKKTTRRRR
eukprot:jgi/Mesvir1/8938/Mv06652-RA.1